MTSDEGIRFVTMNRLAVACATALTAVALTSAPPVVAASNTGISSIAVDPATQIQMHVNANCVAAQNRCYFDTAANLLTAGTAAGFPQDTWARQTITLRSMDRDAYQEAWYSAPAGMPRELKGANHDNVLSKLYKGLRDVEISVTYFGGGPLERFRTDGDSAPLNWSTGLPATGSDFIACSQIQVVYPGVNLTTPTACAQTTFG
ncbi:putative secreted protein [Mycolicibacterium aurum]|uniref:Putative secreted protein n=2 Tax=Mycolicibacterium aurum TaxID=1791 RepID=A0A3S4VT57_MYCAU|nr:putative secreted protein [Mycolicibacterium aurum]